MKFEYQYRAEFQKSKMIMETDDFHHLYNMVKLTLTSDYIEDMRKPEFVFFYRNEDNKGIFTALERRIRLDKDGNDVFDIILHYWNDEYVLRSIRFKPEEA